MSVKMLKLSFKWIFALFACFCLACVPVHAETTSLEDYYIQDFDIDATYHKNNTITQVEKITVNYQEQKHGIYQYIPKKFYVGYKQNESRYGQADTYRLKLKNLSVSGSKYKLTSEDGCYLIKIGDADAYVSGIKTYTIKYTLVLPKDYRPNYDFMYYSLLGNDWQCSIQHLTFNVKFEKPLTQSEVNNFHVFSGYTGSKTNDIPVVYNLTKKGISGEATDIYHGEAVTIFGRLRSHYFVDAYQRSVWPTWLLAGLAALLFIVLLIKEFLGHDEKVVPIVTFHPPEDMDPAAVGYFIDGYADDMDLMALIPYWADKGYVTMEDKSKVHQKPHLIVHKNVDNLPEKARYQRKLFKAMFKDSDTCDFNHLGKKFGKQFINAQDALEWSFLDKHPLRETDSFVYLRFVGMVLFAVAVMSSSYVGFFSNWLAALWVLVTFGICALLFGKSIEQAFDNQSFSKIKILVSLVCLAIGIFVLFKMGEKTGQNVPMWVWYGLSGLAYLSCFFVYRLEKMSAYWKEKAGPLMGLKDFIEKAEVDQLEKLSEENPSYFYDVIPYAMVFDLSEVWIDKFASISIPKPDWYMGHDSNWSTGYFYTTMYSGVHDSISHSVDTYNASQAKSSASFSSGSFGGFSGGGAGGGGGGAW